MRFDGIKPTDECLTSRAGLALFARYIHTTGIVGRLAERFALLRKNGKGLAPAELLHQLLCFFADGT
ncbi:IS1380 family transposase, partial [bacterium]|nr:IS1380 family transposase [bacterium]